MEIIVIAVGMLNINVYLLIILQVFVGMIFYIGVSIILKLDSLQYILENIKNVLKRKKSEVK